MSGGNMIFENQAAGGMYPATNHQRWGAGSNRWSLFAGGVSAAQDTFTANATLTEAHHTAWANATSAGFTITLPAAASHPGRIYIIKKTDASANAVTIGGTVDGVANPTITAQNEVWTIQSSGTAWLRVNNP
jgi:hypothetical protein